MSTPKWPHYGECWRHKKTGVVVRVVSSVYRPKPVVEFRALEYSQDARPGRNRRPRLNRQPIENFINRYERSKP